MTDRQTLYTGVSRAAWGYFFLYFNINLGPVSILPSFVGFLLFLSSISLLKEEQRNLTLLRPLGIMLVIWHGADWGFSWFGGTLDGRFEVLGLIISLASLYFHFQLFTDFAELVQHPSIHLLVICISSTELHINITLFLCIGLHSSSCRSFYVL